MEQKKRLIAVAAVVVILIAGFLVWKGAGSKKISGTYEAETSVDMMPDEMIFENGYCEVDHIWTYTYELKGGRLYFFLGSAVWNSYDCTISGKKIVLEDSYGRVSTYYKQ